MNFLAHIYLSFGDAPITLGNFMADSIRGNRYTHLPAEVQKGIILHRKIDSFTDAHPVARSSSKRLHSRYSHYSRVIVDIYYDHFLARNWDNYSEVPLETYAAHFYDLLHKNFKILPTGVKRMMPYLIADNWLLSYASLPGIARVLSGMNRRTNNRSGMHQATEELELHYTEFESEFTLFFSELIPYAREEYENL